MLDFAGLRETQPAVFDIPFQVALQFLPELLFDGVKTRDINKLTDGLSAFDFAFGCKHLSHFSIALPSTRPQIWHVMHCCLLGLGSDTIACHSSCWTSWKTADWYLITSCLTIDRSITCTLASSICYYTSCLLSCVYHFALCFLYLFVLHCLTFLGSGGGFP